MWCWSGRRGILTELYLCYSTIAQRYEQFLQVGRLYRALVLLGLAICPSASVSSIFMLLYRFTLISLLVALPLIWLTNHRLSVLWRCLLGRLKWPIMCRYGTLNHTIVLPSVRASVHSYRYKIYEHDIMNANEPIYMQIGYMWSTVFLYCILPYRQYL